MSESGLVFGGVWTEQLSGGLEGMELLCRGRSACPLLQPQALNIAEPSLGFPCTLILLDLPPPSRDSGVPKLYHSNMSLSFKKKKKCRASQVAPMVIKNKTKQKHYQWKRQGLIHGQEGPICGGATKPVCHSF